MKKLVAFFVSLLVLGGSLLVSLPSTAAIAANCAVTPKVPYTNGNYVYSETTVKCEHTVPIWVRAVTAGSLNQEKVGVAWVGRGVWKYTHTAPTYSITHKTSYDCNGHGTDTWRNRGFGRDENNGETYTNSAGTSLTC